MGKTKVPILMVLLLGLMLAGGQAWGAALSGQNFHVDATTGFDWDSNVSQQPINRSVAAQVRGQGDMAYYHNVKLWYNLNPAGPWDLETKYDYYQNFHPRLGIYDTLMHTFTVKPSYLSGSTMFYLPFSYNFTDVQSDKYSTNFELSPTVFHRYSQEIGIETSLTLARHYAWTPVAIPEYDRSGRQIGPVLGFYYFYKPGGYIQARVKYDYFAAGGRNNDGSRVHFLLNGVYPLPYHPRFTLNLYVDLGLEPYDHHYFNGTATSFPKRYDTIFNFGSILTYSIYKTLTVNVHYYLTRQASNIPTYDYARHVVGGQLRFTY